MEPIRPTPLSRHAEPHFQIGRSAFCQIRRFPFLALLLAVVMNAAAAGLAGRPLQEVLKEFQSSGIRLIFSSQIVTGQMRVMREPPATNDLDRLRAILAPHGLILAPVAGGSWAIVAADAKHSTSMIAAVRHLHDDSPVAGARVELPDLDRSATTDARGRVRFDHLIPGTYAMTVSAQGFESVTRAVHLTHTRKPRVEDVPLRGDMTSLNEVVVETSRFGLNRAFSEEVTLPRSSLEASADTDEDVARAVQHLPGATSDGLSARSHVRGSRDDETLYRLDGVDLIEPFHLKDFQSLFSAIDPEVTDNVKVWSGDFPVDYGSSIGGVVDIAPRRVVDRTVEVGLSLLNSSLLLATPFDDGRGTILLNGRVSNLSNVADVLRRDIGDPDFQDLTARATWQFTPSTHATAGLLALDDSLLLVDAPTQEAQADYRDVYIWLKLHHDWTRYIASETIISNVTLDSSRTAEVDRPGINDGHLDERKRSTVATLRQELTVSASQAWSVRFGGEVSRANTHYVYQSDAEFQAPFVPYIQSSATSDLNVDLPAKFLIHNAYMAIRWQAASGSVIEAGLRRDGQNFQDQNEQSQWNVRFNALQQLTPKTVLRIGWGQYSQPQAVNGLDVGDGITNLQAARRLDQATISVEQEFGNGFLLRAAAYDKHEESAALLQENIFSYFTLAPEIEVDRIAVQTQGGRMHGIELTVTSDEKRPLSGWFTYSHSRAFDRIDGVDFPRSWDQPDALQAGAAWRHGPWTLSGIVDWHTGWPQTPLIASAYSWQNPNTATLQLGPRNSVRRENFQSFDLRSAWHHALLGGSLEASVELRNAFNSANDCCTQYAVIMGSDGRSHLAASYRGYLPMIPIIGVRWRW